jgi:sugar-specific transcriptional regulator TrmB
MRNEQDAKLLGLTKYEFKAYEALIKIGKTGAAAISSESGVPYGRIYNVLSELEKKGFVTLSPEKTKKFIPSNPIKMIEMLKKKENEINEMKEQMESLHQIYDHKKEEPVIMGTGLANFYRIVNEELPEPEKEKLTMRFLSEVKPQWLAENKDQLKRGIKIKTIADKNAPKECLEEWKTVLPEIKHMINEGLVISIIDEKAILISMIKSNTVLLIKDGPFIRLMKTLFNNTYKDLEKI